MREHYEEKGYRVHSGLQFGCELVLYADDPSKVHSDFCVHVVPEGKSVCVCAGCVRACVTAWLAGASGVRLFVRGTT